MTNPSTDTTDTAPLTKRDTARIKELRHLAEQLKHDNLLYGSALDGMSAGLDESARNLAEYDIDAKVAAAEDELAQSGVQVIGAQFDSLVAIEEELAASEAEEDALVAEDENEPADPSL